MAIKRQILTTSAVIAVLSVLTLTLAGCGSGNDSDPRDSRQADAVGTVATVTKDSSVVAVGFTPDQGYEYFEGTTFEFAAAGGLEAADGTAMDPNMLAVGDRIEVWTDVCAESFPVQCSEPLARLEQ